MRLVNLVDSRKSAHRCFTCSKLIWLSFVHYSTGEAADAAIKAVNGMLLNDKKVFVGHHVGKKERMSKVEEQRAQFTNVFVKNIDPEATDAEFEQVFRPFGEIVSAALGRDDASSNKGYVSIPPVNCDYC
jgi:polyadenylate-binding protein